MRYYSAREIREKLRSAAHDEQYNTWYTIALFLSGDATAIQNAIEGKVYGQSHRWDRFSCLPHYSEIIPSMDRFGLQNHGFINSRINVHGAVVQPEIEFGHPHPVIREYNQAYINWYWNAYGWTTEFQNVGMWTDSCGVGWAELVMDGSRPTWQAVSLLDTLWDPVNRTPGTWEWVAHRRRISKDAAYAAYDQIPGVRQRLKDAVKKHDYYSFGQGDFKSEKYLPEILTQWEFRTADQCMIIIPLSESEDDIIALRYNESGDLEMAGTGMDAKAGPNPFGVLKSAAWTDSWLPMNRRPVGKVSDGIKVAGLLNWVEKFMVSLLKYNPGFTAFDQTKADPKFVEALQECTDIASLKKLIPFDGDPREAIHRIPTAELPASLLQLRSILRDEINANYATQDMNRGQALSGERTREEIKTLADMSGIVPRAFKANYADFVRTVVRQQRHVGALYDTNPTDLFLPSYGQVSTENYPVRQFLEIDMEPNIDPNGRSWMTRDEIEQRAMLKFKEVLAPGIAAGVFDPVKTFEWYAKNAGFANPQAELMYPGGVPPMTQMADTQPAPTQ